MKINLAKSAGFCFGVKRALDMALQTIAASGNVYMLGDIVHNEEVAQDLKKAGAKKVNKLQPGKERIFLVRAHGTGIKEINQARALGYKVIDATCPMVKEIHRIVVDMEKRGYTIIVIGDKKHDEVHGIIGQLKGKAIVIDSPQRITARKIKKAAIVVQSTQNIEKVMKIVNLLKAQIKELKFFNTICRPTSIKQEEIRKLPRENEVMLIIGSKASANTKRLFEISKALNNRSFWVQKRKDIKPQWFKGAQSVGITAGASTPDRTIKEIYEYIKKLPIPSGTG